MPKRPGGLALALAVSLALALGGCTGEGETVRDATPGREAADGAATPGTASGDENGSDSAEPDRGTGEGTGGGPGVTPSDGAEHHGGSGGDGSGRSGGAGLAGHSADLRVVTVEAAGNGLAITFELGAPVRADEPESVVWAVEFLDGDEPVATASAQRIGARLVAAVYDWRSAKQAPVPFTAEGNRLELRLPHRPGAGDDTPDTAPDGGGWRIAWRALTQRDGADGDRLPVKGEMVGYGTARAPNAP